VICRVDVLVDAITRKFYLRKRNSLSKKIYFFLFSVSRVVHFVGSGEEIKITEGVSKRKKKTECVVKTHDRSETFVLQGNIVIIHQSLLNSI
jgi:hypothetical protein